MHGVAVKRRVLSRMCQKEASVSSFTFITHCRPTVQTIRVNVVVIKTTRHIAPMSDQRTECEVGVGEGESTRQEA